MLKIRHTFFGVLILTLTLSFSACSGSPLEQTETGFQERMANLDELAAKSDGDLRKEIEAQKESYLSEYQKLPPKMKSEERAEALGKLNQSSYQYIASAKTRVEAVLKTRSAEKAQQDGEEMAAFRAQFVGTWKAVGMDLTMTKDGSLDYKRLKDGVERKVTAPIKAFRKNEFEAGMLGINTTFRIDKPPYQENGVWKMVIDGVELTRVP